MTMIYMCIVMMILLAVVAGRVKILLFICDMCIALLRQEQKLLVYTITRRPRRDFFSKWAARSTAMILHRVNAWSSKNLRGLTGPHL
jgi:hypothetical protein